MDPVTDILNFLTGRSNDLNSIGGWNYPLLFILYAVTAASVALFIMNWREDRDQRDSRHVALWFVRVLIGFMWFEGMLWKLPFSDDNGLHYWTEQMAGRAAYAVHRDFVQNVILPNFSIFDPIIFFCEFGFACSLITGFCVRLASLGAILLNLNLWLGIYNNRGNDPAEWSWTYIFLAALHVLFIAFAAGRSLGADAWVRRHVAMVRDGRGLGKLIRLAG